jgi:hypothetical protein
MIMQPARAARAAAISASGMASRLLSITIVAGALALIVRRIIALSG